MFPISGVVHFPGTLLALHVFEPRYREMIDDLASRPADQRFLAVPNVPLGRGEDDYCRSTTLAHLDEVETLADGRFDVRLRGLCAIELGEELPGKPYRCALIQQRGEDDPGITSRDADRFRAALRVVLAETELAIEEGPPDLTDNVFSALLPVDLIRQVNEICANSGLPASSRQRLLEGEQTSRFGQILALLERQVRVLDLLRPYRGVQRHPEHN